MMNAEEYRYLCSSLSTGSSLGNPRAFARLDAFTNLCGLWSASDNQFYLGEWRVDLLVDGRMLDGLETSFRPTNQATFYRCGNSTIEKTFLLPFQPIDLPVLNERSLRTGIFLVRLTTATEPLTLTMRHTLVYPARQTPLFTKQPTEGQLQERVLITLDERRATAVTLGAEQRARSFGASHPWTSRRVDDQALVAEYTVALKAGESAEFRTALAFSMQGASEAQSGLAEALECPSPVAEAETAMHDVLSRARITTPDPVINRAIQWAKINTVRVQHRYRIGDAFTNDPPQDIVVVRDLAWYVFGSNYLTPAFSRSLIRFADEYAYHEGGKLAEYLHADEETPEKHDYALNINDDTPLFVIALHHYALTVADAKDREMLYGLMKKASQWIVSQIAAGLVWCKTDGTNVWGICSWRNIIDDYTLNGAVTEVNAECCRALEVTAEMAGVCGFADDQGKWTEEARRMRLAIGSMLESTENGTYLLNISSDKQRHADVTGDLIFLPLFGIAPKHLRSRILDRLTADDMWTPYGSRTVAPSEKNYDPDFGYQLVGGVWPNLTAWVAYCIRKEQPAKFIEGMRNIYRLCEPEIPAEWGNVVPGQFPERLHGETYHSRGMTMSPWLPPTYLWLAVEGLVGLTPKWDRPMIDPALDPEWNWCAVQDLPWRGRRITAFIFEKKVYASEIVDSTLPVVTGQLLSSCSSSPAIVSIALLTGSVVRLFVASEMHSVGTITIELEGKLIRRSVDLAAGQAVMLRIIVGEV